MNTIGTHHAIALTATLAARPSQIIALALLTVAAVGLLTLIYIAWRWVRAIRRLDYYRRLAGRRPPSAHRQETTPPRRAG